MQKTIAKCLYLVAAILVAATIITAQPKNAKSFVFKGTVTEVDAGSKKLMVANEKIEGWMDAMTMGYQVDNPDILKQLKKGDHIEATVYDGDTKLYKVKVAAAQPAGKK
ncbi:MAG TPA: copper-binding protein [Bryobacteraceae bacterium]|jgi:Cu/Ag efflux protein CusF|nr:copper-binding protein [Bryobacteraceae bacterium]